MNPNRLPKKPEPESATHRAIEGVRTLIMEHQLLPGQQIRQEEIATEFGLSRSPVREALRALEAEGLLIHAANQGYFVVRLSADEMRQIYLMRRVIEAEVLRNIGSVAATDVSELREINQDLREAVKAESISSMLAANRRFHFRIFELSGMALMQQYLEQLWHLSESYRATYLWLPETRLRVADEHDAMIAKIEAKDFEGLIQVANDHRANAEERVIALLPRESDSRY